MGYPANKQRNAELVKKRKKGWTFRQLAKYYNINVKTAFDIYKREVVGSYPQKDLDSVGR